MNIDEITYKILKSVDTASKNNINDPKKIFNLEYIALSEKEFPIILDDVITLGYIKGLRVDFKIPNDPNLIINNTPSLSVVAYNFINNYENPEPKETPKISKDFLFQKDDFNSNTIVDDQDNPSIRDLEKLKPILSIEDGEILDKIIQKLSELENNTYPIKKGVLSSFSDFLAKYPVISNIIGQILIIPYPQIEFEEVDTLSDSERGASGYGSTGK